MAELMPTAAEYRKDLKAHRIAQSMSRNLPDVHPNIAELSARKVALLTEAPSHPEERGKAADVIHGPVEKITLTLAPPRGQLNVTPCGELSMILE